MNTVSKLVSDFLNSDYENLRTLPGFTASFSSLYYNNNCIIEKTSSTDVFIKGDTTASFLILVSIIDSIPTLNVRLSDANNIIINDIIWDKKRTNIKLFI